MANLPTDDDAVSSVCDAPPLPNTRARPQIITDQSDSKRTIDEMSQIGIPHTS